MGLNMTSEELAQRRWWVYIPVSCVMSFVFGSTYSLSAFSLALREFDPALLSTYTSALSMQSFLAAITLCAGAYFLDFYPSRLREFTWFGISFMAFQSVSAYGVGLHSESIMFFATSLEGLGVGTLYLIGVEHAARWMPDRPGLAMGITMGSMGMGQIFGARCYDAMAVAAGSVVTAMHLATACFMVPTLVASFYLMYPPEGWDPRSEEELSLLGDNIISNETGVKLGWRLLLQWQFYCLLWIVAMGAGPAFGILSGFPAVLNGLYGMSPSSASSWFAVMSFVSMLTRFFTGILADYCGFGDGFFWSGGKNLAIVLFSLQTLAFAVIGPLFRLGSLGGVLTCLAITFMSFAGASVLAAIMCREMFAPRNAAVVFGIAAGLTDGLATMIFGLYMAHVEDVAEMLTQPENAYLSYFARVTFWSFVGACCSLGMAKCEAAFEEDSSGSDAESGLASEKKVAVSKLNSSEALQVPLSPDGIRSNLYSSTFPVRRTILGTPFAVPLGRSYH